MSTAELDQIHVEHTRDIVSAAAALLCNDELCPLPADGDLGASDAALSSTRRALSRGLDQIASTPGPTEQNRLTALVLESVEAQAKVKDALIEHRAELAIGVRDALASLRNATSTAALTERAPIELRRIGFRRALFSGIEQGTWMARTAFAIDDPDFAAELVAVGQANPRRLNGPLIESEMVRRCTPVVVSDAQSNPRVHLQLVRYAETRSYVAAPVLVWGAPVAMVHADRDTDCAVDEFDRCMLGTYTEGLGLALERTQLMERLQAVRRATTDYVAGVSAIADDLSAEGLDTGGLGLDPTGDRGRLQPISLGDVHGERLTPREWDVLHNLASGKTNAQIASGLFVTEGTVKSHVKHILRKLGATNRTEAVARFHRLASASASKVG
ncbi:response regulator transcription factor [Mycolicibacterium sp.]|uniref:helix-turn-helix transcriptional regulator n=1 Tax=Mycolicibacterium sp. TaxID=2320850 RepID=UPI001A235B92|nr:response regulator transcription factor [Mycolicibacterium sp.]MBJ7337538.1 response regulator transcription factor [Mycolicibacterium sp.]